MNIIGLTGPSGAGKSELCKLARKKMIPVIDADAVYHSLLVKDSECTLALAEAFGKDILDSEGAPNRKKLGNIVFSSEEKLLHLNEIVLHFVCDNIDATITALDGAKVKNVIVDAPTLIEAGYHRKCSTVVSVLADKEKRVERIMLRDGISKEAATKRVNAQKSDSFYIENSDIVIENNSTSEDFQALAEELLTKILE